ncbi:MAG TPA: acetyl-CoA hydrolase/transferase C-terminal domain-containing protein [Candidatus Anoxymicrobiaceae bacterium]
MNRWQDIYKSKLTTAEEAAKTVNDGDKIFCGSGSCSPAALLDALFDRADELNNVTIGGLIMLAPLYRILTVEHIKHIEFDNCYATPLDRKALQEGICTHTPFHFSEMPRQAGEFSGYKKVFTQVSPMDEHGYLSCGVSGNFLDTFEWIDELVLEVNEQQPRINGMNFYHIDDPKVRCVTESSVPIIDLPPDPTTDADRAIAEQIAGYVDDGATIQLGIGALPNAIGECLMDKNDLGCYTEMIPDAIMKLADAGVINNSRKTYYPYQFNSFFAAGSAALYKWLDNNPHIYFNPVSINNNPYNVGKNDNLISVNSTLEIDITGQCCSEAFGPHQYSATGGQVDFTRGAWLSKGGKSFIATHSTARDHDTGETVSKIVPTLRQGAPVTLTRTDVMYVATEHGVVCLKGLNLRERARALISVAHPDFRSELRNYAKEVKYFILPEHEA